MLDLRYQNERSVRLPAQWTFIRDRSHFLAEVALAGGVLSSGGALIGGRFGFTLASCGTLALTYFAGAIGRRILRNSIVLTAILCVYGAQIAAQAVVAAFDAPALEPRAQFGIYEHTTAITVGHMCLLVGTLLAAGMLSLMSPRTGSLAGDLRKMPTNRTKVYLVAAILLTVSASVVPYALSGSARYWSFVLTNNIDAVCFFVGWFASDLGLVGFLCLVGLIGNALVEGLLGTRYGMVLLAIYVVGRLVSPRERRRSQIAMAIATLTIPVLLVFNAVGVLRAKQGRGSLDLLNASNLNALVSTTAESANEEGSQESSLESVSRLYAWPNAAAVALTPDLVPYRGFQQWFSELKSYATVFGNSEGGKEQALRDRTGTYHADDYGFSSSLNSTVEFGVVADGWSTAGPLGVVIFAFLAALILCGTERILANRGLTSAAALVMLCVLCRISIMCYVYPLPLIIRSALLNSVMWLLIVICADRFGKVQSRVLRSKS